MDALQRTLQKLIAGGEEGARTVSASLRRTLAAALALQQRQVGPHSVPRISSPVCAHLAGQEDSLNGWCIDAYVCVYTARWRDR
jgi:hypothetical protein